MARYQVRQIGHADISEHRMMRGHLLKIEVSIAPEN